MTWIDQPPYADGSVLRVVDMNGVRGNLNDTEAGIASAAGDMFYATAENTIARLAFPAEGSTMRAGASAPYWQAVVEGEHDTVTTAEDDRIATWGAYRQTYLGA